MALPDLNIGDFVEIEGLQGAKELNGRQGRIVKFVIESARFGVQLLDDGEFKAVKPENLRKIDPPELEEDSEEDEEEESEDEEEEVAEAGAGPAGSASASQGVKEEMQDQLVDVMAKLKSCPEGSKERAALQKILQDLVTRMKAIEEEEQKMLYERELQKLQLGHARATAKAQAKERRAAQGAGKMAQGSPVVMMPPPPSEQHHPLPQRQKESALSSQMMRMAMQPRPQPPPLLPTRPKDAAPVKKLPEPVYSDEHEYPDPALANRALNVLLGALVCGIVTSQAELCPAWWFVWSYLLVHLIGVIFLTDYAGESGLLVLSATFGLHAGVALSEFLLWVCGRDGADSVGPWSVLVFFSAILYFHSFWMECVTLPPDYITSISLFFPMFPAFNAAVALSCAELFLEWRYFPEYKIWGSAVFLGICCMAAGQYLIATACRTSQRNFWASCRNMPEEEEKPEDFVGLEIPDRRIVQEGAYRWERHPAYLGAMLWGIGAEIALCNPIMLVVVGFVLWASLLYVALEEEQELYDEFKYGYANYSALTCCWIPLFNSFLENAAFQREMTDNAEELDDPMNDEDEDYDESEEEEDVQSEDDMLPTWEGVPKGGALWNRQFRDPWLLG